MFFSKCEKCSQFRKKKKSLGGGNADASAVSHRKQVLAWCARRMPAAAASRYPSALQSWLRQPLVFVQVLICEKPISPVRGWVGAGREPRLKRVDLWERLVRLPGGAALNWEKPNKPDYPWQSAFVCHGAVLPDGNIQVLSPRRRLRIIAFWGK